MPKRFYWTTYWKLSQDPFSEEPLYYSMAGFNKLLVRYRPLEEVDEIISGIHQHKDRLIRRRYYIIGLRGMGKTTLFNYIMWKVVNKPSLRLLPIYVNNLHVKEPSDTFDPAKDPEKLRLNFCLRTIENLFNVVLHTLKRIGVLSEDLAAFFEDRRRQYYDKKGQGMIDQSTSEQLLLEYLHRLREAFDMFILMYDELDKIDDYHVVLRFLRSSQGLFERLSPYGCVIFLSGVPEFAHMLRKSEYSGVSGYEITIHPWSFNDAKTLIRSRLNYVMFTGVFPFQRGVVEEICSRAEGRPRLIQKYAREALIWTAYRRIRKIDVGFMRNLIWRDESVKRFREEIRQSKDLEEASQKLRSVYNPDKDDPSLYFILTKIFETSRIFKLPPSKLREEYGIDMDMNKFERLIQLLKQYKVINERWSQRKRYYVLESKIQHLFDYVKGVLKESIEYLPQVIKMSSQEVRALQPAFNLRNETLKILIANSNRRFRKVDLAKEIITSPDAKNRALVYYKVASEKELLSKLKLGLTKVLYKLHKESNVTKLLIGRSNFYQFSETATEMEFAKNLRLNEEVFKNFQSAINSFRSADYDGAITVLRLAVENSLRNLAEFCKVGLPSRSKEDTLGPINDRLYNAKIYDQGLKTMIIAFATQVNPIAHGRVKLKSADRAKLLIEQAKMIIRELYLIKKNVRVKNS